jgi:hypothetical protein
MPLEVLASSYDPEKSCTPPDHVLWCDESRTTSLHHQGDGTTSSPSTLWAAVGNLCGFHDPHDLQY